MMDRAYINFWTKTNGDPESALLDRFQRFLDTVPQSEAQPGFTRLLIRAVSPAESPVVEHDLRRSHSTSADMIALAREYPEPDNEYEIETQWDLWRPDADGNWERGPVPLLLLCRGPLYDDGIAAQSGQFEADLGFEALFTGGEESGDPGQGESNNTEKLAQNVRHLFGWVRRVETSLPIERYQLWSEGEENLEARLDDIVSLH